MSEIFSRELDQYSYKDKAASLLVVFGKTSNSTCNDDLPRKQLWRWATLQTSTLVPTLETLYWFPDRFIRPIILRWFFCLDKLHWLFVRCSLFFTSKILQVESSSRHCASHLHPFCWCSSLRHSLRNIIFPAWFRTAWLVFATHLDLCSSAISGTFWICRTVSASFTDSCSRSNCNVRLLAEDQVRRFHFYNRTKTAGIFAIIKPSRATTSLSSYLRTCEHFMPQRCSFLHLKNLFLLLLNVICLRVAALTPTVAD